ncbi:hypothetical protein PSU4_38390 [Pseudonocardia sulfidoxydans NBRC 16205]|uniref:Uncharacterized protein n=1 Tax=Pseudonocardia sulfidoxydans NBRC 16205 TaxID=1223511 RepID=A0A511DJ96_9PSEU|nr:hypothetical protein [Pseudonocardia sulfidoxydans]GEL24885.1 hypothetical protein PSU4_38390 [Pseudonocardia sulfidoxydans NBRC 16205]
MSDPTFTDDHTTTVAASDQGSDYADPGYADTTTHDDSSYDSGYGSGYQVVDRNDNGIDDTVIVELAPGVQGAIVDVNEDGTPDVVLVDIDGNGSYDASIQPDGKGGFVVSVDTDGDGRPDESRTVGRDELDSVFPGLAEVLDPSGTGAHNGTVSDTSGGGSGQPVVYDTNDNGIDDTVAVELAPGVQGLIVDVNEDGTPDVVMIDLDGNGKIDTMIKADGKGDFVIGYDDNQDGKVDRQEPITREQLDAAVPGLADVLDPSTGGHNTTVSDGAVGSPSDPRELDTDKNGVTDAVAFQIAPGIQAVAVDPDEDGRFDAVLIDMSGDGTLDTMVAPDGSGGFVIGYDDDGDGQVDRQETATRAQLDRAVPGLADALDPRGGSGGGGRNV